MELSSLLTHPAIHDVITTERTLFIVARDAAVPTVYSDREVVVVPLEELPYHPRLRELLTGTSLAKGPLRDQHRLRPAILYEYALGGLDAPAKQRLSHALYGSGGRSSLLDALGGTRIGRAAFLIPPDAQERIETFLAEHGATWTARSVLLEGDDR